MSRLRNFRRNDLQTQEKRSLVDRDHLAPAFERLVLDHRAVDDTGGFERGGEIPKAPNGPPATPPQPPTLANNNPQYKGPPPHSLILGTALVALFAIRTAA